MISKKSNVFALPHTFFNHSPRKVFEELQEAGITGINVALNYHASRDFLLRQGPRLEYLKDGFHYYRPDLTSYDSDGLAPNLNDSFPNSEMLEDVISSAEEMNFEINAWAVFLHNSALSQDRPEATCVNVYGSHFRSELCPGNPLVRRYIQGLAKDLSSRGIASLAIESLHFHGTNHGEHHERFFLEMGAITSFLFSLCFCQSCMDLFSSRGGDPLSLKARVISSLKPFLESQDPWLEAELTKENLQEIVGSDLLDYLLMREELVTSLIGEVSKIAHAHDVQTAFIDQSPLIQGSGLKPLNSSWQVGVNPAEVRRNVDIYEPLIYRKTPLEVESVAKHYREVVGGEMVPILRPTYPDNGTQESLTEKVSLLNRVGVYGIDFYLLDTMRARDLGWIKNALSHE